MRCLEIGPGKKPINGFESLNLGDGKNTTGGKPTHASDARELPFENNTFDIIYCSHVIEHIQWYQIEDTIKEWARTLKFGGSLEIWTVNGYKVSKALVEFEETGVWSGPDPDDWKNKQVQPWLKSNPYNWVNGKLFNYAKKGDYDPHIHRAILTPKFLKQCFEKAGLKNIRDMNRSEVRGYDHGWINMGVCGVKL